MSRLKAAVGTTQEMFGSVREVWLRAAQQQGNVRLLSSSGRRSLAVRANLASVYRCRMTLAAFYGRDSAASQRIPRSCHI